MANELIVTQAAALAALVDKSTGDTLTAAEWTTLKAALQEANAATRAANVVFAGPAAGGAAVARFRALVAADIPDLSSLYAAALHGHAIGEVSGLGTAAARNVGTSSTNLVEVQSDGKILGSLLPALAISETFPVASQAAMLALTAQRGDVAIRTDLNTSFILSTDSPGTLADWKELLSPTDGVFSFNTRAGAVTLLAGDVTSALGLTPFANPMTTAGDLITGGASGAATRLAMGSALQVLRVNAGATALEFADPSGGAPGGSDTYVQFNNSAAFGGDAGMTYSTFFQRLTLAGGLSLGTGGTEAVLPGAGNRIVFLVNGAQWAAAHPGGFEVYSTGQYVWSDLNGPGDTGLARGSAGVVKVTDASSGYGRLLAGSLAVNNAASATTPGSCVKKVELFDAAGASLGFLPVYSAIT